MAAGKTSFVLGPPAPVNVDWPSDSNVYPFYLMTAGVGLALIWGVAFPMTGGGPEPLAPSALVWSAAILLSALPMWLAYATVRRLGRTRKYEFGVEAVVVPNASFFSDGSQTIRYDDITQIERIRTAHRLHLKDDRIVKLSTYRTVDMQIVRAFQLRVAHALEQNGRPAAAIEMYEEASYYFDPGLEHRITSARLRIEDEEPDDILESLMKAVIEHELTHGPDDRCTRYLRDGLEQLKKSWNAELPRDFEETKNQVMKIRAGKANLPVPTLRDDWVPR